MRFAPPARRSTCVFLAALLVLATSLTAHAQTTTFSGTVYSPLAPTSGDILPLPNILVFVEDSFPQDSQNFAPTKFDIGISVPNGGCAAQPSLVPPSVLGSATTKPDGTFSFNAAGVLPDPVNLYIQAGKWRLKTSIPLSLINVGGSNTFSLNMPSMAGTGANAYGSTNADLPNVAVVTGTADDVECIFPQIGISASEVTDPSGTGHINLFPGHAGGGEEVSSSSPSGTQLLDTTIAGAVPITNYDLVIFGCQGPPGQTDSDSFNNTYLNNLVSYANSGGRIFATHWEFPFITNPAPWAPLSSFSTSSTHQASSETGTLATTGNFYTGEPTLAAWMTAIGALDVNAAKLQFTLTNVFDNNVLSVNAPAQDWLDVTESAYGTKSNQFSFDTPIGAAGTPSAQVNFSNSTTVFLTGDPNDVVTAAVSNTSTTPTATGLTLTLTIPSVLQILSVADSSGGFWSCVQTSSTVYICTLPAILAAGASDSVAVAFKIPLGTTLGLYSLTGVLSGGGINQSSQCGRVLYNDYHVEDSVSAKALWNNGSRCSTAALTNAKKFLEYSLYNLSSFVAPANSDTIQIQQSSLISWTVPSPLYYGTTISQIEAPASVNTPGTTSITFTPSGTDLLDPGSYNFKLVFTPTDTTDYLSSSATRPVTILQDPTVATLDNLDTSIFYGQEIGYTNGVDIALDVVIQPNLPNLLTYPTLTGGALNLTLDGVSVCSGIAGMPIMSGSRPGACPDAGFLGYNAGPHTLYFSYAGTKDFAASNATYTVIVNPDPTTTTLASSANPSYNLRAITLTASVADTYAQPLGAVLFYDSPTPVAAGAVPTGTLIGTVTLDAAGHALFIFTAASTGTHNLLACFTPSLNQSGTYNYLLSCSASVPQVVLPVPLPPTVTLLTSSLNPSVSGQPVSFTASVATTGAFVAIPTGSATFYDGTTQLNSTPLAADGTAVFTTTTLAVGSHPITAVYSGSATLAPSTSAILTQVVNVPLPNATGFLLLTSSTGVSVPVGSTGSVAVRILELTNFNQPVQLACTGLPAQSTCTFDSSLIPAEGGTTQLAVWSSAPHNCNSSGQYFVTPAGNATLPLLGLSVLTLCLARRRKKLQGLALLALLTLLPLSLTGCGSGVCTDFGLKPGDYTFTITGTSTGSPVVVRSQAMSMHVHL